jgi:hypothetical protein
MNIIKTLEELVKVKDELYRLDKQIRWQADQVDRIAADLVEFLKDQRIIEPKTVR